MPPSAPASPDGRRATRESTLSRSGTRDGEGLVLREFGEKRKQAEHLGDTLYLFASDDLAQWTYLHTFTVAAGTEVPLASIHGNSLELAVDLRPGSAARCGLKVCRSPDRAEETVIVYDRAAQTLGIDTRKSSLGDDASQSVVRRSNSRRSRL